MKKKQQRGFTIIELLIATTVFSVILVICLGAFLRVGQLYYKGVYLSKTQEAARDISDDMVAQLRFNGTHTQLSADPVLKNGYKIYFVCMGSERYSFMSGYVEGSRMEDPRYPQYFGLIRDDWSPPAPCLSPTDPKAQFSDDLTELLTDNMRMNADGTGSDLSSTCSGSICNLHVHIDFGDDDLLDNPAQPGATCTGALSGSQFCATTDLDTTVYPL